MADYHTLPTAATHTRRTGTTNQTNERQTKQQTSGRDGAGMRKGAGKVDKAGHMCMAPICVEGNRVLLARLVVCDVWCMFAAVWGHTMTFIMCAAVRAAH